MASFRFNARPFPNIGSVYLDPQTKPGKGWSVVSRMRVWHQATRLKEAKVWAEQEFTGITSWKRHADGRYIAQTQNP